MNGLTTTEGDTPLPQPCILDAGRRQRPELKWIAWLSGHQTAGLSRPGPGKAANEDAILVRRDGRDTVLVVADGVGGGEYPQIAARTAVYAFAERPVRNGSDLRLGLFDADRDVAEAISMRTRHPGGATAVAGHAFRGDASVSHVGDAAAKLLRRPRWPRRGWRCIPLTLDHTYANEGKVSPDGHGANAPSRIVGLGARPSEPAFVRLAEGDVLLLCSDGLAKHVSHEVLETLAERLLRSRGEAALGAFLEVLHDEARRNGSRDDISIVCLRRQSVLREGFVLALLSVLVGVVFLI